ncbi:NAD(P)/FAD-dependent oxidoreductase [Aquibacillus kalidii]|uniref:NAD(P)/FAD-dependent oxidoreductase n=1 Tax=Aquibacillus kalidii TaxID=2762597 RepID=UPI0016480575|nr:NAD(P)/FAD-dependent oxidoreductase [Aquibacillus kalidii]
MLYDCAVIGGGIAGLQAAIQLGRYQHNVIVIDSKSEGRSNWCRCYHNVLGWPEGVSGETLREIGTKQAKELGITFIDDTIETVKRDGADFLLEGLNHSFYRAKRILFATGVKDRLPLPKNIFPCLGKSIYVCPDCDGYEIKGKKALVLGSGNVGAKMALTLSYWTNNLIFINHDQADINKETIHKLNSMGIKIFDGSIQQVMTNEDRLEGVILNNGEKVLANHAFVAFRGNEVMSGLAKQLGVELHTNEHILVNPRTQMTSVDHVWAAGDVVAHSEQVTIAMGDGMQAAIWIHKTLL